MGRRRLRLALLILASRDLRLILIGVVIGLLWAAALAQLAIMQASSGTPVARPTTAQPTPGAAGPGR